jgi:hypothetical protein
MKKTAAKPKTKPAPAKPKRGKGSGKPNFHTRAKQHGVDISAKNPEVPEVRMEVDADLVAALEGARGRPVSLTAELGSRIVTCYARGDTMEELASHEGMPAWQTIYTWLATKGEGEKAKLYNAFREAFTRAKELRAHTRIGKIEELVRRTSTTKAQRDNGEVDAIDPTSARVAIEGHRILMELENRGAYGKQLTLKGDKDNPLQVRTAKELTREELLAIAQGGLENAE